MAAHTPIQMRENLISPAVKNISLQGAPQLG